MLLIRRPTRSVAELRDGCVATIGAFDGLHLGHRQILDRMLSVAAERQLPSLVFSFEPTPKEYFSRETPPARLMKFREKFQACSLAQRRNKRFHVVIHRAKPPIPSDRWINGPTYTLLQLTESGDKGVIDTPSAKIESVLCVAQVRQKILTAMAPCRVRCRGVPLSGNHKIPLGLLARSTATAIHITQLPFLGPYQSSQIIRTQLYSSQLSSPSRRGIVYRTPLRQATKRAPE